MKVPSSFPDKNGKRVRVGDEVLYRHDDVTAYTVVIRKILRVRNGNVVFNNLNPESVLLYIEDLDRLPKNKKQRDSFIMLKMLEGVAIHDGNSQ